MAAQKITPKKVVKKPAAKAKAVARRSSSYTGPREPHITSDVTSAVVDEIPPARGSGDRKYRYAKVLADIREQVGPGKPVKLAEFVGATGAQVVRRGLMDGSKPVDGRVEDWQFDARRLESGGSVLYATLKADR
jgi:hypothetical protein